MSEMPVLFLPGELIRLKIGIGQTLDHHSHVAPVLPNVLDKLEAAETRTGFTLTEAASLVDCTPKTLTRKLAAINFRKPAGRNVQLPLFVIYSLAMPRISMAIASLDVSPDNPARLTWLTYAELYALASVAQRLARLAPDDESGGHLTEWLQLGSDNVTRVPVAEVLPYWAKLFSPKDHKAVQVYANLTQRGLFYQTKIRTGYMTLVKKVQGQVHFKTGYLLQSEIVLYGRNSWALRQTNPDASLSRPQRLLPG